MEERVLNKSLHRASMAKNDEFYTQLTDIEKELGHYKEHLKGKTVFCNCDDPQESNFWKYFALNFKFLGLKKLIATHYETEKPSYKLELVKDVNKDGKIDDLDTIITPLKQNGDFRSPECIEILKESDIVITNPPFSLFREYVAQLISFKRKFLIIGNTNAITYKEIFKLIKEDRFRTGYTNFNVGMFFVVPNSWEHFHHIDKDGKKIARVSTSCWFTNLEVKKHKQDIILYKKYSGNEAEFPEYDNYEAINVAKVSDIPMDFKGAMGVPITFLDKYNPEQFEIIGQMATTKVDEFNHGYPFINGKKVYARIIIKNKRI